MSISRRSILIALAALGTAPLHRAAAQSSVRPTTLEAGVEYFAPRTADRDLRMVALDIGFGRVLAPRVDGRVAVHLTSFVARGNIEQLESANGGLQRVRHASDGNGFGLSVRGSMTPVHVGRAHLGGEMHVGLVVPNDPFPFGGSHFNGLLRLGPVARIDVSARSQLVLASHWSHLSNGQGLGAHNPSYEAWTLSAGWSRVLTRVPHETTRRIVGAAITGGVIGGLAAGAFSLRCPNQSCNIAPGMTAAGVITGAGLGAVLVHF